MYTHLPGVLLSLVCWIQHGHNVIKADAVPVLEVGLTVYWGAQLSNYIKGGKCHEEGRQAPHKSTGQGHFNQLTSFFTYEKLRLMPKINPYNV